MFLVRNCKNKVTIQPTTTDSSPHLQSQFMSEYNRQNILNSSDSFIELSTFDLKRS